ncbi:PAS domain-containing protein [Salipiger mucosus]|uniref:PAS domain-containing protein n=1 Tax=Salipiger mucosus DSM 16094 TaxID=1123237 RepID=S9RJS0_9RHOB|nr:PAS domain-containing protein [Salipiger mucosus]EPX78370.1 hypothetical protein Salmuc_03986 [Salipiger mucosus DSM 16094]
MFGKSDEERDVVSMTDREKERRLAPIRLLEAYWHGLAAQSGAVPLRSQIDPRGIETALEYAFLAERIAPMLAKLRVAGTHLNEVMGMDTGGMPLSALFAPKDRDRLGEGVAQVFADGACVRAELRGEDGFGRSALSGHLLLLPLRSDMGDMTRMIGALVTSGRIGRTPRRFHIASMTVTPGFEIAPKPVAQAPHRVELAETPAPFKPAPRQSEKRPHLRLVISND